MQPCASFCTLLCVMLLQFVRVIYSRQWARSTVSPQPVVALLTQNLIVYHCSCKHSLSFRAKYTQEVAQTYFILTAITQGHGNPILHNLRERGIHYCFDLRCFHTISVLPLHAEQNVAVFIGLLSYTSRNGSRIPIDFYLLFTSCQIPETEIENIRIIFGHTTIL